MQANSLQLWLTPFAIELPTAVAALPLQNLRINSLEVQSGDVFLALPGTKTHGNQFIEKALAAGAVLVLTDTQPALNDQRIVVVPKLIELLSALAAAFYPHQAQQLLGVTGTNGKSSTAIFVNQLAVLLKQQAAVIGTLGYGDYRNLTPLNNTTPHLVDIHRILSTEAAKGAELVAMEVSSHALVQQRVAGLQFEVAVFTNLTRDHLDYHGTMQAYGDAKALLFKPDLANKAVINVSDDFGRQLAADCVLPVLAYGQLTDCVGYSDYLAYDQLEITPLGYQFRLSSHLGQQQLQLKVLGEFNIQNVLAAMGAMLQLGHSFEALVLAVQQLCSVPGRIEQFYQASRKVMAVVDYAHTPDALEQTLIAVRNHCQGQLWLVFGCGGDRDKGKRPLMGAIAERLADQLIITADNPRTEDVMAICLDIAAGCTAGQYQLISDRKTAIRSALEQAQAGDLVLIAGKGHEDYQIIGHEVLPYDERAFVRQLVTETAL
ncbi:MAG: UDP-N-acetylmuramoyl-L-alanyl-D-glutamate--2,6-diaminopimelate ligase [Gammaproteobacteria bacterium]|nr:UDP-N-acetylmuramoyl-L-alanyl-D-glutamate--2,6-diaminopimelate ligase [Gammaproteobacteria bacterium]MBU2056924.1 UDP-N-acetylmuramoyl-L-alanyl-D-glutamate--2,6-diaminopimelate ligase [Gammaproteobacteria bacterium]MBU2174544.1 UDP-N-acetylmuramoyl-L-alanyl-D-glutamate--2,6-diaminopimelate ligase [Gammaproteobacteria bacterium]MBU2248236.1 UDP-N-acetylmuramoyl-L-alanyl-D-glutamate--2,6-diaminopimelate ligase [Gammaproteobacteria bacterium]MBU2343759.1 UDP-N-acetylmuramoyl-L-alanyl-D-glutamat